MKLELGFDLLNDMLELEVGVSGRQLQLQNLCQELKQADESTEKSGSYYAYLFRHYFCTELLEFRPAGRSC